jgi:hypothetical protein
LAFSGDIDSLRAAHDHALAEEQGQLALLRAATHKRLEALAALKAATPWHWRDEPKDVLSRVVWLEELRDQLAPAPGGPI